MDPSLWLSGIHFYKGRPAIPVLRNGFHSPLGSSPASKCCLGQGRIRSRIFHIIRNHPSSKRLELTAISLQGLLGKTPGAITGDVISEVDLVSATGNESGEEIEGLPAFAVECFFSFPT